MVANEWYYYDILRMYDEYVIRMLIGSLVMWWVVNSWKGMVLLGYVKDVWWVCYNNIGWLFDDMIIGIKSID